MEEGGLKGAATPRIHDKRSPRFQAEALGFEGMALGDHLVTYETRYQDHDYRKDARIPWYAETHWPDVWVMFAALWHYRPRNGR